MAEEKVLLVNPKTGIEKFFVKEVSHRAIREYGWIRKDLIKDKPKSPAEIENEKLKAEIAMLKAAESAKLEKPAEAAAEGTEPLSEPKKTAAPKKTKTRKK